MSLIKIRQKGIAFEILPEIEANKQEVRTIVFPKYKMPKANPDYRDKYTGKYYDLKRPDSMSNILRNAKKAVLEQDAIAIISCERMKIKPTLKQIKTKAATIFKSG